MLERSLVGVMPSNPNLSSEREGAQSATLIMLAKYDPQGLHEATHDLNNQQNRCLWQRKEENCGEAAAKARPWSVQK